MKSRELPKRVARIETETSIVPQVVADGVISEAEGITGMEIPDHDRIVWYLVDYAEQVYAGNKEWARRINGAGNRGRDTLYAYMRHWLTFYLKKYYANVYQKIPHSFAVGEEPIV